MMSAAAVCAHMPVRVLWRVLVVIRGFGVLLAHS
jgi:hypothetical protein